MICPLLNMSRTDQSIQCIKENCAFYIDAGEDQGACAIRVMAEAQLDFIAMSYRNSVEKGVAVGKTIIK